MKTNITISVDVSVIAAARNRIGNISEFCNNAMKQIVDLPEKELPDSVNQLKSLLAGKSAEIAELQKYIEKREEEEEQRKPVRSIGKLD